MHRSVGQRRVWLACVGLAALSLALYARTVSFDFVDFDDPRVLLGHPHLYDESSLWASLHQIFLGAFPREEPLLLRDLSWALDARAFGFRNPAGYHLGNVVLNAASVVLLFLFLFHETRRYGFALSVAGVFALLPVHVEPVAWIMGRKDLLCAFWILSALLAQSHELAQPLPQRRRVLYLLTILFTLLALLSKIAALSCCLLLALHRIFHPYLSAQRAPDAPLDWRRVLREAVPRVAPHVVLTLGVVCWYRHVLADYGVIGWRGSSPLSLEHLGNVATFAPLVIGRYVGSLLWPTQLSAFYRWPSVEIPLSHGEQLAALGIAAASLAALLYCGRRRRDLSFYLLGFLALLLPYLNVVFVDLWRADRYVYLASFCAVAALAGVLERWRSAGSLARSLAVPGLALCFALASAVKTREQQAVWRDSESLWRHEAHLDAPSLLAIQAYATLSVRRAEREADPVERRHLAERAEREIERGFARERSLDRHPSGYATSEQLQLARLHVLLGRVDALLQRPLESQLVHYQAAHRIAPHRGSALLLANTYMELAQRAPGPERAGLARSALRYARAYAELCGRDPARLATSDALLEALLRRFPFLRSELLASGRPPPR